MNKALVVGLVSGEYTLFELKEKNTFLAKPRGVFRNNQINIKVGDYVEYEKGSPFSMITKVMARKNELVRPPIANIDQAIVVTSLKEPDLNLNLLDRVLAILEYRDIEPILVFSKNDLLTDNEKQKMEQIVAYYKAMQYQTFITTYQEKAIIDLIRPYLRDKISVMVGQSGVGKSSLLNMINETYHLKTDAISKALNRGKHTTRYTVLLPFENGWIADSPGFGTVDLDELDEQVLSQSFRDFFELSKSCKYKGCLHLNEPGCFVKKEVENGHILKSRYDNYVLLQQEIKKKRKW